MRTLKPPAVNIKYWLGILVTFLVLLVATLGSAWPQDLTSRPEVSARHLQPPSAAAMGYGSPGSTGSNLGVPEQNFPTSVEGSVTGLEIAWRPHSLLDGFWSKNLGPAASFSTAQIADALDGGCATSGGPGRTATLLPDGSLLLLGGLGRAGVVSSALLEPPGSSQLTLLLTALKTPRAWQTSTLLPDGRVLVLGGVDSAGNVVATAELFDPSAATFSPLTTTGPKARAYHSATVLTDGTVLVAGGLSSAGVVLSSAELWDPRTATRTALSAELSVPRRNHCAVLLSDGRVLLWGGTNATGERLNNGELYDPNTKTFSLVNAIPPDALASGEGPVLVASNPENGAQNVPLLGVIALRFSEHISVTTVNLNTVTLNGPQGTVSIKAVPAERGRLAFVTYNQPLLPGTNYSLLLNGLKDAANRPLPPTQIVFTTESTPTAEVGISEGTGGASGAQDSLSRRLPPLQASPGITAIAGQVLQISGRPLANVTIRLDGTTDQTRTDSTGRFLLVLPGTAITGHRQIVIDGKTAGSTSTKTYGLFEYGMNVKPGITNVLPFIIWMPSLDTAHVVTIPVPTKKETIVTTPLLPGLELLIPAGTVIQDYYGHVVHQITITPIPVNQPPFPLPNVPVPIYFTIQPGGAWLTKINASGPDGAQLYYPNTYHKKPGTVYQFWNYNPDAQGWYIYGLGRVAPGGQQIVPDPGVLIYGFSGAMVGDAGAPPNGPAPGNTCCPAAGGSCPGPCIDGDPVDLGTGLFVYTHTDLELADVILLRLTRTYRPNDPTSRAFGIGTTHPYDIFIISPDQDNDIYLILPDGGRVHFGPQGEEWVCTSSPTSFFGATIAGGSLGGNPTWVLTKKDGTIITFPEAPGASTPQQEAIIAWQDRNGNSLTLTRDSNSNLTRVSSPNGRYIQFVLDSNGRIAQATDNIGRVVRYAYDGNGRLSTVMDAKGGVTTYTYDGTTSNMVTIEDPRLIAYLTNQYDSNNRIVRQTRIDGGVFQFSYVLDENNNVLEITVTDPRNNVRQTTFNSNGYTLTDTRAMGTPQQEAISFNRNASTNLVNSTTDALNRMTSYAYDSLGNVLSITQLYGTPDAVTTSFTYDPTFSQVTSVTDPMNHLTQFTYDAAGDLITLTDALQHQWTFTYNDLGQVVSATDPLSQTTNFSYSNGSLASVIDPLSRTTVLGRDGSGRLLSLLDPAGALTQYQYDPLDKLTGRTDALGGVTSFVYDADEDLITVTDALNHSTSYTYDNLDRLSTRVDPLQHPERYTYDLDGNLQTFTDRRGNETTFNYDPLSRRTQATYADRSLTSYTYDLGNRLIQAQDSSSGTITRTYDGLNRLTGESTAQGSVSYTYDAAGRRSSMTAAGQPAVSYVFDDANRLTQINQASSTVNIMYDNTNRRTSLQLPNAVTENYSYDIASEPTGITYKLGVMTLGNLTYTYDADGRRTSMGGTYARTNLGLSPVLAQRVYNADNQLVQWGSASLRYDANGNLIDDSANTYTWNARNQLSSINAGITASFQYDAFGRRVSKTIAGINTGFLYDYLNPVQELANGTPTANMLSGLAVDEFVSRTDLTGARYFLTDALGSTLALTDSGGNVQTEYSYEPFGSTSITGQPSSNSYQYTGRESDNIGLYYYRTRFYSPTMGRFIKEDLPTFIPADPNLYRYVRNNPINLIDPAGLWFGIREPEEGSADPLGCLLAELQNPGNPGLCGSPVPPWPLSYLAYIPAYNLGGQEDSTQLTISDWSYLHPPASCPGVSGR